MSQEKQQHDYWITIILDDLSDNISTASKQELDEWLTMSESNKKLYDDIKEIWATLDVMDQAAQFDDKAAFLKLKEKMDDKIVEKTSRKVTMRDVFRYAAIIIPFAFMSYFTYSYFAINRESPLATISTPKGSTSKVVFNDGSKVLLNSSSEIIVAASFGDKERRIMLDGEAYLEVTRNTSSPFVVQTEKVEVKVLGTVFNVNAASESEDVKITLESGNVELSFDEGTKLLLKPNEQAIYNIASGKIRIEEADMNKVLAWKNNHMIFSGETFEDIILTMEQRFDMNITIYNDNLKKQRFVGDFVNNETIEQILNVMASNKTFRYTIQGNVINIY